MPKKLTQAEFLAKAVAVHGVGRYDYSLVEYGGAETKVKIICPEHGEFMQIANAHLVGKGCTKCANLRASQRKTASLNEFIKAAQGVHGDKYDYSQATYQGSKVDIKINCPAHGYFNQKPNNHLRGNGCSACGIESGLKQYVLSKSEFINRAFVVHGNKYDYSLVNISTTKNKISIICPEHGVFEQGLGLHLYGSGCPKCGNARISAAMLDTKESFLAKAKQKHGNTYDYKDVDYQGIYCKVSITCPIHGKFWQKPVDHIRGTGCPSCGRLVQSKAKTRSLISFVEKASLRHNGKYDYGLTIYTKAKEKVVITCPTHGSFEQQADSHLRGCGCPACSLFDKKEGWLARAKGRPSTLYLLRIFDENECFYKIGITCKSVAERYGKKSLSGYKYEILASHQSANPERIFDWEQSIIETFSLLRYIPKRNFIGASECFSDANGILLIFPL